MAKKVAAKKKTAAKKKAAQKKKVTPKKKESPVKGEAIAHLVSIMSAINLYGLKTQVGQGICHAAEAFLVKHGPKEDD